MIPRVLSIAGSASQGSAGIQADLKTFEEHNVYGMSAVTALVANNSVTDTGVFTQPVESVQAQVHASMEHVGADALKTGMLFTKEIIEATAELLKRYKQVPYVLDPVMIGKMGTQLLKEEAVESLKEELIPLAAVITPNLQEAGKLLGRRASETIEEMERDVKQLHSFGADYVLLKGGGLSDYPAVDLLFDGTEVKEYRSERIDTIHTSGAGCTYSASIAAGLAKGLPMDRAVEEAKYFVTEAIRHALSFGEGIGSTYHAAERIFGRKR
ncbi:phosphomethylpyrimidine kinase [Salimicrobium jeotgali]|nr:bifunctional hydroxymethylpyrimidine kinase/phosphomethylpyrimidine kinase [Salimicrobium jeotgali]EKE31890.1 phosphomethylpyrimidine kinase [Salimicrobium jeotgali]MBM7696073.1 pyridoxine kinase/hydroxymethylpyrimidine/phosphomethylpyrimidine kinase [Salimicrobium jeotgali]